MTYVGSYVWQLRQVWGSKTLLLPGTTALLMNDKDEVLLGYRSDTHEWSYFGGIGEIGQSVEDSMKREVIEEVGVTPTAYVPFGFTSRAESNTNHYPGGDTLHFWDLCFLVTKWDGEIGIADDEHTEIKFFALNALPAALAKNAEVALKLLQEYKRTGQFQIW